jgi:pimeloyl-ACP methyl ester carboxylesterase
LLSPELDGKPQEILIAAGPGASRIAAVADARALALTQRPFAERAMTEASDVAWKAIPSWFIFGTRDNSIPVNLLAFMAERAGSKKSVTIEGASHAVMISHADAVVELVIAATRDRFVETTSTCLTNYPLLFGVRRFNLFHRYSRATSGL